MTQSNIIKHFEVRITVCRCCVMSASPYIILSHEKSVVEHNPGESLVFLSVAVDACPSSWTLHWFKDGDHIVVDNPRITAA